MSKQTINIGASPNDGTGTPLRTSFDYTNQNFTELYTALGGGVGLPGATTQVIFNDGGTNLAGDAGLVYNKTTDTLTAGNATITGAATVGTTLGVTGDLTVDTNVLKVDTTNNRVGILTASPRSSFALDVLGNVALGDSTTTTGLRLKLDCAGTAGNIAVMSFASAGTNKAFYGLSGGYLGDASTDAIVATDAAGAGIRFFVADTGVEVARFNSTGNLAFANTKGIDFSAVTGGTGTATANVLNDYEEGTWTPTAGDAASGGNQATTAVAVGRYTKIGRLVTVHFELASINTTGLTAGNSMNVRGLPFAASSATTQFGTIAGAGITFTGFLTSGVYNGSAFPIYATSTGGALADIKVSGFASGTASIFGTLTYFV